MRRRVSLLTLAIALTGCSASVSPATTAAQAPPSSAAPVTTAPAAASFETRPCTESPPRDFSLLCQAYTLVQETHVDPVQAPELAAAAVLGVEQAEPSAAEEPDEPFVCVLPDPSFDRLCQAIAEQDVAGTFELGELVEAGVQGMFRYGLDPFSSYIPPDLADQLDEFASGAIFTLGMVVGAVDEADAPCGPVSPMCRLTVLAVFDFTPAANGGVVPGDVILSVAGSPLDGLSPTEAIATLWGEAGTSVVIELDRPAGMITKSLVHEDIRLEPVEFDMLGPNIAYLRLNDFSQLSAQLTGRALQSPEVRGAGGMILDLRGNPGGLLLAAQAVASQFLQGGDVMLEHFRGGVVPVPVLEGGLAPGLPLVILVDRGSASAAEVVAAVLQERGRATVVGAPTFGKNLVQEIHAARNGGELRVSVARWSTPGGLDIGISGLQPDVVVERPADAVGDPALDAAVNLLGG